jgi:hypothetical protein
VKIDDTMRPARLRALWLASASAGAILVVGLFAVRAATGSESAGRGD